MIKRADGIGFVASFLGHVLLLAVLSLSFINQTKPPVLAQEKMEVDLVGDIGLRSAAPKPSQEAPAEAAAPEVGPTEDAAPAEEVAPPAPKPQAVPQPAPTPKKPEPVTKPAPAPAKAAAKPTPKPTPKPDTKPKPQASKPEPAKNASAKTADAKAAPAKPAAKPAASAGKSGSGTATKPRSSRLGDDFLAGISESSKGKGSAPRAELTGAQMTGLARAIAAQIKPCYVIPSGGTGADMIVTELRLRFKPDGSVASTPEVVGHSGVTGANRAYVQQMDDAAKRAVMRCSPLRLPPTLYEGGWEDIIFNFTPRDIN